MNTLPTLRELLDAGVHFGHKKGLTQPSSKSFIFTLRDGIYVINLEKTLDYLDQAINFIKQLLKDKKIILFVGTKRQVKDLLESTAKSINMPYISNRWLGGMLTNFGTLLDSTKKLNDLDLYFKSKEFEVLPKKEKLKLQEKSVKLHQLLDGVINLKKLPDALFIIDPSEENIALSEAKKLDIPVIALCDTNSNPDKIDYPIACNDDSQKAISLILNNILENIKQLNSIKDK